MKENELGWGWYDPEEERKRLNDSALAYSRKRGLKEGKEIGLVEGTQQAKQEMVLAMYAKNLSLEDIEEISGLSQEEVETIINSSKGDIV